MSPVKEGNLALLSQWTGSLRGACLDKLLQIHCNFVDNLIH